MSNSYEKFRTTLIMNLCSVLQPEQLTGVLEAVDMSMQDYEITRKQMDLITTAGVPEVVKAFIASKAIANCSMNDLQREHRRVYA